MKRYAEKLGSLGILDPYSVPQVLFKPIKSLDSLPNVQYPDIVNYLIFNPSAYTGQEMKAYKSTDAYRYFQAGWVNDTVLWHLENKTFYIIMAKVFSLFILLCGQWPRTP